MWFFWGRRQRCDQLTHTTYNVIQHAPRFALAIFDPNDPVRYLVLDQPPANAMDLVALAEINEVAEALSLEKSVRVVMLRSALEPIFCTLKCDYMQRSLVQQRQR
jgi:hypothetical protein